MHDPRIGRFFAVDPLAGKYPHNSPYAFSENTVINAVELEGLEKHVLYTPNGQETINGPWSLETLEAMAKEKGGTYEGYVGGNLRERPNIGPLVEGQSHAYYKPEAYGIQLLGEVKISNSKQTKKSISNGNQSSVGGLDYYYWKGFEYISFGLVDSDKLSPEFKRAFTPVPDAISIDLTGSIVPGLGANGTLHLNFILKGEDASIDPFLTLEYGQQGGYGGGLGFGGSVYTKIRGGITQQNFVTQSPPYNMNGKDSPTYTGNLGISVFGKAGISGSYTDISDENGYNAIMGVDLQIGVSPPGPNVSGGISNSKMLVDRDMMRSLRKGFGY